MKNEKNVSEDYIDKNSIKSAYMEIKKLKDWIIRIKDGQVSVITED